MVLIMSVKIQNISLSVILGCIILSLSGLPVSAQILSEDYAANADILILNNEIDIFSTIEEGVRLSVAECELFESCSASVNRDELDQLITTINTRINSLSLRYSDSGESGLEEVLVSYVDIRDNYNQILEKIESMPQFETEDLESDVGFDAFFSFGPVNNEVSDELMDLYRDVDEEITDDESFIGEEPSSTENQ